MIKSWDTPPNLLAVLVIFSGAYAIMFGLAALISTILAATDRSAHLLTKSRERWLSDHAFRLALNVVFVILIAPIIIVTVRTLHAGIDLGAFTFALFYIAGTYHGTLIGDIVDEYGRVPGLWDFFYRAIPH